MVCQFLFYVNVAYNIPLVPDEDATIPLTTLLDDIGTEFTVTFTLSTNSAITKQFKLSENAIEKTATSLTLLIVSGDITTPGYYNIKYNYIDKAGKSRAIPPCPRRIRFHTQ